MGILTNSDWFGATVDRRVIERCVKRCSLGDIREWTPTPGEDGEAQGKGPEEVVLVNLTLEEPARSTEGEELRPGFPVVGRINVWPDRREEAMAKVKELALAALGLPRNTKENASVLLEGQGGWAGLKGKHVLVTFDVRKGKKDGGTFQECVRYDRVGNATPTPAA
jgi:hypothetical protein